MRKIGLLSCLCRWLVRKLFLLWVSLLLWIMSLVGLLIIVRWLFRCSSCRGVVLRVVLVLFID